MLKKFVLRNYKNFKDDICIDFENIAGYQFSTDCIADKFISKMLIYGRNATGKTNLGKALLDIKSILFGIVRFSREGLFLNADSTEDSAFFSYVFQFDDEEVIYKYARFSNLDLRDEELIINGVTIFKCDFFNRRYQFDNLKYIGAETANKERYLQSLEADEAEIAEPKLSFLRWLINNMALENNSVLIKLSDYVVRMVMMTVSDTMMVRPGRMNERFFEILESSEVLQEFEEFLNEMGVECKLILKKLPDGQKELYFAHEKLVPFYENASSGTLALVNLYRRFVLSVRNASFMYLDEFDAFYHYEMAENVVRFFKRRYPKCQVIMTTHNTNLMTNRLMRPDCLFILSRRGTLTSLCNATMRELREGHNLEKMYISGEFEKYE